jgi:anti-anti-sigma factor
MTSEFSADTRSDAGNIWVVRVKGEVDVSNAPKLEAIIEQVADSAPSRVLVELEDVTFLDSSGIRALVLAQRRLEEVGAPLVIDGMSAAVERVLEVAGLIDSFKTGAGDGSSGS